jgi:hypothetical protein
MMQAGCLKLLILLVTISCPAMAQVGKLYPVDEGPKDPSFQEFRARLIEAVKNRDTKFILSILDPNITNSFGFRASRIDVAKNRGAKFIPSILDPNVTNSFGSDEGAKLFKEKWKPDDPNSELWETLTEILSMGGSFSHGNKNDFCAPYVFGKFPDQFDSFEHSAIIGENVRIREQPGLTSPVIATLSYDIVALADSSTRPVEKEGHSWIAIELSNDKTGFVSKQFIRSPIDYRVCFTKKNGKWRMTALVAGD